jgi:signal transduction histidine kinase
MRRAHLTFRIIAGVCAALAFRPGHAAERAPANPRLTGTPLLRVWRADDYNADVLNNRLLVHPNGLVYVANEDGVLEFDGERWRLIAMPREGASRSLALDPAGRVWAFGHDDAARLEPDARGELRAVSVIALLPPEARATGTISRATATADGVYARGQRWLMLFRSDGTVKTWTGANISGLVWTLNGELYADLESLVKVSPAGIEPISLGGDPAGLLSDSLRVFATQVTNAATGEAILLTMRGPVRWRGPGTSFLPLSAASSAAFASDAASAGAFLADGRLALGTERSGLFIFERDGTLSQRYDRTHGLPGNRITDLAVDADGGLWLTLHEGIARLDLESPFALHGAPQGLTSNARRFATWRDQLYVSVSEGVVRRDVATGRFTAVAGFQVGTNRPLALGDRLVASTRGLREITANDQSQAWTTELIGPIIAAKQQPGWIFAGSSAGLWFIRPDANRSGWETVGRVTTVTFGLDELLDRGDGWLWVVSRSGQVARVDLREGPRLDAPVTVFKPEEGVPEAARNDHVQLVTLGPDLLAVGADWLRRFDAATNRFVPETRLTLDGATVKGARLAGRSSTGGVWFRPVENGGQLLRVESAAATATIATTAWQITARSIAPFRSVTFDSAFEQTSTRTLWLAGQGVLASIDLAWQPARPPAAPRVIIRRVETESGELLAGGNLLAGTLQLQAEQNAVRIAYAAPLYRADHRGRPQTLYRTRLDGLDREWSEWTTDTRRDFTNLPYRALRFRVQARAPDRPDSAETTFLLAIAPPWWLTAWAFAGYIVVAAGAIYGGVKARTHALRRRNAQLEAIIAARTRQLERVNVELTDAVRIVAHDLRGPVAGIRSLARQLRATPHIWASPEGPEFLGEIERTSGDAVDMMARLLDLQRASDRAAGLTLAPVDVGALINEVGQQLAPAAAEKKIALTVAAPADLRVTDAESVASIAANLVSNALKFLPADGRGAVSMTFDADEAVCRLTVADNGPGISAAERETLFEKFVRGTARPTAGEASTGLGLFIVKKLAVALHGTIAISDTPGGGATFIVAWPAARAG